MLIAQVTDTHVGFRPDSPDRVRAVLDWLLAMEPRPDVLVVTGDVADHGLPEEYLLARETFAAWPGEVLWCPGNHDSRAAMREHLLNLPTGASLNVARTVGGTHLILLDSILEPHDVAPDSVQLRTALPGGTPRIDAGRLSDNALAFLAAGLAEHPEPTIVCLHHPPVPIDSALMDPIMLENPEPLAELIGTHPQVIAVLVGHAHQMTWTTFAGKPLLIGGGTASAVSLDEEELPPIWADAPLTFALHRMHPDGRLQTTWRALRY